MERREQYDPEDIEALLMERPFEELLPEERAFVLRHLKDADEYEAMRATLNALRNLHEDNAPVEADPMVRENVMAAFHEQRRPRIRIWLNSVGASLIPGEARGFWMPSLRLATLAAVVGIGVWGLYRAGAGVQDAGIVQLNEVEKNEAPPVAQPTTGAGTDASEVTSPNADPAPLDHSSSGQGEHVLAPEPKEEVAMKRVEAEAPAFTDGPNSTRAQDAVAAHKEEENMVLFDAATPDITMELHAAPAASATAGATVARDEQVVEAVTVSKKKAERKDAAKRARTMEDEKPGKTDAASSQALDARLLSLQNAAW